MGCSVSCSAVLPVSSPYEVPQSKEKTTPKAVKDIPEASHDIPETNQDFPEAINDIMGQEVDRNHPMYLYAVFCLTRLLEQYKNLMFPHSRADMNTFSDNETNYTAVVNEIYDSLNFDEIRIESNSRLGSDFQEKAKDAVQELTYLYFLCSVSSIEVVIVKTMVFKVDEEFLANKKTLACDDALKVLYEDTLKMLITDLERKDIYTPSVFYNNRRFQEWVKFKEPTAWKEMRRKSVTFVITSDNGECLPAVENSPSKLPKRSTKLPYNRLFSIQSSDSIGFYYSDCSQTDINEEMASMEKRSSVNILEVDSPEIWKRIANK